MYTPHKPLVLIVVHAPRPTSDRVGQVARHREKMAVTRAACGGVKRSRQRCWDNAGGGVYVDGCGSVGKVDQGHVCDQAGDGGACDHRS